MSVRIARDNYKYLNEINSAKEELSVDLNDESEDWLAVLGRGGLTHIGNMMFALFLFMQLENDIRLIS